MTSKSKTMNPTSPTATHENDPNRTREVRAAVDGLIAETDRYNRARVDEERRAERVRFQYD